jgi:hypothetical protein
MRKSVLSVVLFVLGMAPAAQAVPVEVNYSVSSTLTLPALALTLGTLTGSSTIRYVGTGLNTTNGPAGGFAAPARIQSFNAAGPLAFAVGTASFTGSVAAAAPAQVNGALASAGGALTLPLAGSASGSIHCTGALCAGVGLPASVPVPISLVFNTVLSDASAVPTGPGALTLVGALGTFAGFTIIATTTLTEISRTVVPEPGTASLVWLGLTGLAGARWHLRRRRNQ